MNARAKEKLISHLRSGAYKQGYGALRQVNERSEICWCPMGILCDIVKGGAWWEWNETKFAFRMPGDEQSGPHVVHPPAKLLKASGLDELAMRIITKMNDEQDESFTTIAKWIEEHV